MKAFTITGRGRVMEGIALHGAAKDKIWVGEPGRGRSFVRVPLPKGAQVADERLVSVPSRFPGALVLIKDQSGFRGSWSLTTVPEPCSQGVGTAVGDNYPCPECGEGLWHSFAATEVRAADLGVLVAEGRCAQGIAGRKGGGPEYLVAIPSGTEFGIRRAGRLYGEPAHLIVRVGADKITIQAARDIFAQAQASQAWEAFTPSD